MPMFSDKQKNVVGWFVIALVIGLPAATILDYTNIWQNPVGAAIDRGFKPGNVGQVVITDQWELSRFTMTAVKEGAVATKITSALVYIWFDWNQDGAMKLGAFGGYSKTGGLVGGEIETTATDATTGVFTSPSAYPISPQIYVDIDDNAETYENAFTTIQMSGHPAADFSAMPMGNVLVRACGETSVDYAGLVRGVAIDDGTDYNYTTNGAQGRWDIRVTWATQYTGVTPNYNPTFYLNDGKVVNWGTGLTYVPNFLGGYCTIQDAIDMGLKPSDWDYYWQGVTYTYFAKFISPSTPNTFYGASDLSAPTMTFSADIAMTAIGQIEYVGLFHGSTITYDNFKLGIWGPTTASHLYATTTAIGIDWDWKP